MEGAPTAVSLIPCDYCGKRVPEKLAQTSWAWYRADGQRTAYRQRLCTTCFCTTVLPLDKPLDLDELHCPACGESTQHDMDPVYATVYIPGSGKQQFEFPTCPACAAELRTRAQKGAVKLEDRPVGGPGSGPPTHTTRESYWSSISSVLSDEPA